MSSSRGAAKVIAMPSARPQGIRPGDDLTLIDGISAATALHLRQAGVSTFAMLAALQPNELVVTLDEKYEVSAALEVRPEWITQARSLMNPGPRLVPRGARISAWELTAAVPEACKPFSVILTLDLGGIAAETVCYHCRLTARLLPSAEPVEIACADGVALAGSSLVVALEGCRLDSGTYRLSARISLDFRAAPGEPQPQPVSVSASRLVAVG